MEAAEHRLEQAYLRQIAHLEELKDCLALERDKLIDADIEAIWRISEEKQKILTSAKENAEALKSFRDDGSRYPGDALVEDRPAIKALSQRAALLKEEIRTMTADNMSVVRDSLSFVEELLGIFTTDGRLGRVYGKAHKNVRASQPHKLSKEV